MILSPAKLNISLNVNGLLDNNYHSISSYVFFLDLFDKYETNCFFLFMRGINLILELKDFAIVDFLLLKNCCL